MPESSKLKCSLQRLKQRAFLMSEIRAYFALKNVLEVETPILSSAGNTDINIESFTSEKINHDYLKSYLRTSPEFPLKRLLCDGVGDIFEIGKVFRRGEISKTHNIEFSMLEWYRLGFDYFDLIQDVEELFKSLFSAFGEQISATEIITFNDCFQHYLTIHPQQISVDELNKICETVGYGGSQLSRDEALDFLFATQIQTKFNKQTLTFVSLYPSSQAALAQINPEDSSSSLRFEVFYQGHELGNGYQELTDGAVLQKRFETDNMVRKANNNSSIAIDKNLIAAMQDGMPACSGIAVGVDRLLMVLLGCETISEVMAFTGRNS